MVPILLFGLVGIVGVAAIFRVLGDETDYAGDDLDENGEIPDPVDDTEKANGPVPPNGEAPGDSKDP
ncbi:hypothetical protein [Aquicoccus sp. SU-CL01552]|uniref:hypothetical protein n=1 Tax=Aquicoccus sp. SU-CL01552 TaxID=3127656 RepID=UPI0031031CBE